jgi:hypothetical protein
MVMVFHQRSAEVDLGSSPVFCLLVLQRSTGASGQPLWSNTAGPPVDQQWHLMPTVDCHKTDEQNSGGPLVAATT